jgi:hypothetical protein
MWVSFKFSFKFSLNSLEDYEFTSVYDRMIAERASRRVKESRKLASPTQAQRAIIGKEEDAAKRADWLLDFNGSESPFEGVDFGVLLVSCGVDRAEYP